VISYALWMLISATSDLTLLFSLNWAALLASDNFSLVPWHSYWFKFRTALKAVALSPNSTKAKLVLMGPPPSPELAFAFLSTERMFKTRPTVLNRSNRFSSDISSGTFLTSTSVLLQDRVLLLISLNFLANGWCWEIDTEPKVRYKCFRRNKAVKEV